MSAKSSPTRRLAVALGAASLAGCSFAPAYAPPVVQAPAAYKEAPGWSSAAPADARPRGSWWRAFQDAQLDQLESQVDSANPTLAAALSTYDQARAFAAEAGADEAATASVSGSATDNRQSDVRPLRGQGQPNTYAANTLGGAVSYEVDFWGRVRNLVAAGVALAQASDADLATARLALHVQLADTYIALNGLDAQTDLLRTTVAAYRRALDLTQARHNGGVASGIDVARAAAQLASAQAQISDVAAQRALYEHAIAALTGQVASSFSLPVDSEPRRIPAPPAAGLPSALIQRRPDIAAAERRAFAANRQIGVAKAAFFPELTLQAQGGFQNTGGSSLLVAPDTFWTIGPELAATLFDGGRRRAVLAASRAAFLIASAQYRATVLAAFQQVEDGLALSTRYANEAASEAEAVAASRKAADIALIRYREGATNYLEVVVSQTAELQAEQSALALETRRRQAAVDLVRALGGGWSTTELGPRAGIS